MLIGRLPSWRQHQEAAAPIKLATGGHHSYMLVLYSMSAWSSLGLCVREVIANGLGTSVEVSRVRRPSFLEFIQR